MPTARHTIRPGQHPEAGGVAIEFVLIFPLLFALFYGIISYALPLLMMQAFHAAAADGARAAVSVILEPEDTYETRVRETASDVSSERVAWLMPLSGDRITVTSSVDAGVLSVRVAYPGYLANPPLPVLTLPLVGDIPRLPDTLAGEASVRL